MAEIQLAPYLHRVQYYETDQMAIAHHSNYIRWMEEARVDYLDRLGLGYGALEALGITSPVLQVDGRFKSMSRFGETVSIQVRLTRYTGTRLELSYEMRDAGTGALRFLGESAHCFIRAASGRPVSPVRAAPAFHQGFSALAGR